MEACFSIQLRLNFRMAAQAPDRDIFLSVAFIAIRDECGTRHGGVRPREIPRGGSIESDIGDEPNDHYNPEEKRRLRVLQDHGHTLRIQRLPIRMATKI